MGSAIRNDQLLKKILSENEISIVKLYSTGLASSIAVKVILRSKSSIPDSIAARLREICNDADAWPPIPAKIVVRNEVTGKVDEIPVF